MRLSQHYESRSQPTPTVLPLLRAISHAIVDVRLRGLDVVVQVEAEGGHQLAHRIEPSLGHVLVIERYTIT